MTENVVVRQKEKSFSLVKVTLIILGGLSIPKIAGHSRPNRSTRFNMEFLDFVL